MHVSAAQRLGPGARDRERVVGDHQVRGGGVCAHHARTEAAHRQRVPAGGLRGGRDGRRRERRAGAQERRHRHRHGLGQRGGHGGERARAARQQLRLDSDRHRERSPRVRQPAQGDPVPAARRLHRRDLSHPGQRVPGRAAAALRLPHDLHLYPHGHVPRAGAHVREGREGPAAQATAHPPPPPGRLAPHRPGLPLPGHLRGPLLASGLLPLPDLVRPLPSGRHLLRLRQVAAQLPGPLARAAQRARLHRPDHLLRVPGDHAGVRQRVRHAHQLPIAAAQCARAAAHPKPVDLRCAAGHRCAHAPHCVPALRQQGVQHAAHTPRVLLPALALWPTARAARRAPEVARATKTLGFSQVRLVESSN